MKLCLVGCGRWGKAYLETIKKINSINVDSIVLRKSIPKINESYNFSYNLDTLLDKRDIDGVIIVSPPETHLELAKICIKHRKPVLIEKPFTNSYEQSNFLKEEFYKNQLACMVGFQHLFSEKYKLSQHTNHDKDIFKLCLKLINNFFIQRYGVYQVQVTAINLEQINNQRDLFFNNQNDKNNIDNIIDDINNKFGDLMLRPARLSSEFESPDVISPSWRPKGCKKSL